MAPIDAMDAMDAAERLAALDADGRGGGRRDPEALLRRTATVLLDAGVAGHVAIEVDGEPPLRVELPGPSPAGRVERARIVVDGEEVGRIEAAAPRGRAPSRTDRFLLGVAARRLGEVLARVRLDEALASERARLEALVRALPVGVFIVDADGWLVQANDAAVALWGETPVVGPEEYTRYRAWRLDGRAVESLDYPLARARAERRQVVLDADIETFRGERRRVRHIAAPVTDPAGRVVGAVVVNVDLTDRARLEQEHEEAIARLQAVVDRMPAGLLVAEAETGRIVVANEGALDGRWGLQPGTSTIDDLRERRMEWPDGTPIPFEDWALVRALRHGEPTRGRQVVVILPDGARREMSIDATPVRRADGSVHSAIVVFSDITELQAAKRRADLLGAASRALIERLDVATVLQGVVRHAVPALADLCAVDLADGSGRLRRVAWTERDTGQGGPFGGLEALRRALPLARRVIDADRPLCWPALATCDRASAEDEALLRDLGLTSLVAVPLPGRERPLGVFELGTTTSGRRFEVADLELLTELASRLGLAVENARLYEQAQEAIAGRDAVLRAAAHDLRGPLSYIQLQAELLLQRVDRPHGVDPARVREGLDGIGRNARRTTRQIDRLLDVAVLQAGRALTLTLEPVDLAAVAREAVEALTPALEAAGCATTLALDAPVVGRWDRLRLEQVVSNLVGNAVKYAPGRPVRVEVSQEGTAGRLVVEDHGVGIAPEDLPSLFRPFRRVGDPTRAPGTGLGLWIVHEVVDALGGRVDVRSAPGVGTTFTVELPLAGPAGAEAG